MAENTWNRNDVDAKPPAKRKVRPLIKPLDIPPPPPTAFDLFYEEEKQKWNKEYRQILLGSSCRGMSETRLEKRMRRALALRWKSLTEDERARFEDRAKQQSASIQRRIARYKYITGQLNPKYLYAVNKDGTQMNSIDWSKQMANPNRAMQKGIDPPTHHGASLLLQSKFGKKQAPMSPPPPILSPPLLLSAKMGLATLSSQQPTPKTAPSEPSGFQGKWSVKNSFDHKFDTLIRDMAGS